MIFFHLLRRFWNQIFTCVSVNRNEAANPARSDELKYLFSWQRKWQLELCTLKMIERQLTFLYQKLIPIETLALAKKRFWFSYSVCNASTDYYCPLICPSIHRHHHRQSIHWHRRLTHAMNLIADSVTKWWLPSSVNLWRMQTAYQAFSFLQLLSN